MKRLAALTLSVILGMSLLYCPVKANTYASDYLRIYRASLSTGNRSGQLSLSFTVTTTNPMTALGISSITVFTSDGQYKGTLYGSTSNGLLVSGRNSHGGTYTISGTPGEEYYLQVNFIARDSSSADSKTLTTNTAMAAR